MSEKDELIKIFQFSGKEEDWEDWSFGFMARATLHGYADILTGIETCPSKQKVLDDSKNATIGQIDKDKNKLLYALNNKAWAHLVSSMKPTTCKAAISILRLCQTTDLPQGNTYMGCKALQDHFMIKSVVTSQQLLSEFYDKRMKLGVNPSEYG